jgi:hypothetical protein
MIVEPALFQGELAIGQVEQPDVAARVQWFISKYEPLYLRKLLGKALAELFACEYANETHDAKWDVLADKVRPLLLGYIYFYYQLNAETVSTGVGEVSEQSENAVRTSATYKMVRAWNEMSHGSVEFCSWIDRTVYPEYGGYCITDIYGMKNTFGL